MRRDTNFGFGAGNVHTMYRERGGVDFTVMCTGVPLGGERGHETYLVKTGDGRPGAARIACCDGKPPVARRWRPATGKVGWEFPCSMGEPVESAECTAERELEEAGVSAIDAQLVQEVCADTGALCNPVAAVELVVKSEDALLAAFGASAGRVPDTAPVAPLLRTASCLAPAELERMVAADEV